MIRIEPNIWRFISMETSEVITSHTPESFPLSAEMSINFLSLTDGKVKGLSTSVSFSLEFLRESTVLFIFKKQNNCAVLLQASSRIYYLIVVKFHSTVKFQQWTEPFGTREPAEH